MITNIILILLITFLTVCFAISKLIHISHLKHLFDEPLEDRKVHLVKTPNLGGVAILAVLVFSVSLFMPENGIASIKYLNAAVVILFALGLTDDLIGVDPLKKFIAQILVAVLATTMAGIRFESFYGILGINEIPYLISVALSVLFIVFLMNAVNLIDGINGLAGSIGLVSCIIFSYFFWRLNNPGFLFISIGMCGCLTGFLLYNITPAKIFMGDTGSLFLGFALSVFSIQFLNLNAVADVKMYLPIAAPAIVFAILIIPVFDTLRVFILRLVNKRSPFDADRNHVHHLLLDLNLSHLQATGILIGVNISVLAITNLIAALRAEYILLIITCYILLLLGVLIFAKSKFSLHQVNKRRPGYTDDVPDPLVFDLRHFTSKIQKKKASVVEKN